MHRLKLIHIVWMMGFAALLLIIFNFHRESSVFYGITESREIAINSEYAVEVKNIPVLPGQATLLGELLLELDRPELTLEISKIAHELEELQTEDINKSNTLKAQISELKAHKASRQSELNYQIRELQAQYELNKELSSQLMNNPQKPQGEIKAGCDRSGNPLALKIESLNKALELEINPMQIRINMLEREFEMPENPLQVRIASLKRELALLQEEQKKLKIYSPVAGIVGSVNYKPGEKVSPFNTILTLHPKSPSLVKGYVHENVYNEVAAAQKVKLTSLALKDRVISGEVVGVGSRIVEFPDRLLKRPDIKLWGREILVRIPEDNHFLLGEKVLISAQDGRKSCWRSLLDKLRPQQESYAGVIANHPPACPTNPILANIVTVQSLGDLPEIEASGAIYLKELKQYLVISDDTQDNMPLLYLMDELGTVAQAIPIEGLAQVEDLESITGDEKGNIYLACSQKANSKGKVAERKKLLLKVKPVKNTLRLERQINLYDGLQEAAKRAPNAPWSKFLVSGGSLINIEGLCYRDNALFLGFKSPLKDGKAVILKIGDLEKAFQENRFNEQEMSLWKEFQLQDDYLQAPGGIADLCLNGNRLFILSTVKVKTQDEKNRAGNLWVYDLSTGQLRLLKCFKNQKPEGIAFNSDTQEYLITFDNGSHRPAQFMKLRIP